jgi:5-methylcytosine-specific restriction endonuclease McrA
MSKEHRNNEQQKYYQDERTAVFDIYGHCCGVCGSTSHLTTLHIYARADGDTDDRSNLYPLCEDDHRKLEKTIERKGKK